MGFGTDSASRRKQNYQDTFIFEGACSRKKSWKQLRKTINGARASTDLSRQQAHTNRALPYAEIDRFSQLPQTTLQNRWDPLYAAAATPCHQLEISISCASMAFLGMAAAKNKFAAGMLRRKQTARQADRQAEKTDRQTDEHIEVLRGFE